MEETVPGKKPKPTLVRLLIGLVSLAFCSTLAWYFFQSYQIIPRHPAKGQASLPGVTDQPGGPPNLTETTRPLPGQTVEVPEKELPVENQPLLSLQDDTGRESKDPAASAAPDACGRATERLQAFFAGLDQQDYILRQNLDQPSQKYFLAMADKLLANPPVTVREADDLITVLHNTAHLFRVLGKNNILLAREVMNQEDGVLEDLAAHLFVLMDGKNCPSTALAWQPQLEQLYEYAVYFLNTMGGRAYLYRRPSRIRLLVSYYAVRLIDLANTANKNPHGFDLGPLLPSLSTEMETATGLIHRDRYVDILLDLQEKYPGKEQTAE